MTGSKINIPKLAVIALTALSSHAYAGGDKAGNGGGGFCVGTKCYTAAEAGLRIEQAAAIQRWKPSLETVNELQAIEAIIPFGKADKFALSVLDFSRTNYQPVARVDRALFNKVVKSYQDILEEQKFSAAGELKFFAISETRPAYSQQDMAITYILPEYGNLNPRQQALILIHERGIRNGMSLSAALRFDGVLLDFLNNHDDPDFDRLPFLSLLQQSGDFKHRQDTLYYALYRLQQKLGRAPTLADFLDADVNELERLVSKTGGATIHVGDIALIKSTRLVPEFDVLFKTVTLELLSSNPYENPGQRHELYQMTANDYVEGVCQAIKTQADLGHYALIRDMGNLSIYAVNCAAKSGAAYPAMSVVISGGSVDGDAGLSLR